MKKSPNPDEITLVRIDHVSKNYILGKNVVTALHNIDLQINRGEFLAISGPSGSGKTTILNILGCIERPTEGQVTIEDRDTRNLNDDELSTLRSSRIGFIFQNFNLLPVLTALENVEYPLLRHSVPESERRKRAQEALSAVGLSSHEAHRPMELSGGQRQRVAIARAIVTQPALILADEPTANLDHATGVSILELMQDLNRKKKMTFVFSTHDPKVMERASRLVPLWDGKLKKAEE